MEVILLDKVVGLGALGDKANVKPGYARNYLIPQGKAVRASKENREAFEARRAELEREQASRLADAQKRADSMAGLALEIPVKAGEGGKLFGSVGSGDVVAALGDAGHEVARSQVRLPGESIRELGEYEVVVHVHPGVDANLTLVVEEGS